MLSKDNSDKNDEINFNSLELFEKEYKLKLITIKVSCPKCDHSWGIKCSEFETLKDIPKRKFICMDCLE